MTIAKTIDRRTVILGLGTTLAGALLACGGSSPSGSVQEATLPAAAAGSPTLAPLGTARENPVPLGKEYAFDGGKGVVITGLERAADAKVLGFNQFNTKPEAGQEYILVSANYKCYVQTGTCNFSPMEFRVVGKQGKIYDYNMMTVVPDTSKATQELFNNGEASVLLPFIVGQDDDDFVVIWVAGSRIPAVYLATE